MIHTTPLPIEVYTATFKAETYHYRLVHPLTGQVKLGNYTPEQLVKANGFFRAQNAQGFNIYARPIGFQYLLLDDLTRDILSEVAQLKPCMLIETSPGNYQAWLILAEIPGNRDSAKEICQELAVRFGADLASAEPDHVGRLPGFTNRKAKYQQADGYFPYITLHKAEHRSCLFYPNGGAVLQTPTLINQSTVVHHTTNNSISEQDFGVACGLIRMGKSDSEIYQHLLNTSPALDTRKGKHAESYLGRTIRNAHRAVQSHTIR